MVLFLIVIMMSQIGVRRDDVTEKQLVPVYFIRAVMFLCLMSLSGFSSHPMNHNTKIRIHLLPHHHESMFSLLG